ncbi:hypothetical protein SYK_06570 [Pseudodesulfovibrio nedwellii]|uniref:Tail fiber domain-containing protein n=1 Tax=Pseudodesulfovibrio nedwellii TaxID=2973072 RepID=A0ABN6RZ76_9BACT|nr:hypothetical protein [Pseudodesulfovibrio nedwellii]BDQ36297.1 hypothetical protein SYK_06570 [Pseudodesulfovibrio nedwellii]
MKVYEKIVFDMATLEVIEEVSYEYDGPVSLCKGGGSTTTNSIDYEYNKRMASVAEEELEMGRGYYDFWMENNADFEKAKIASNMELMPLQTGLEKSQIESQQALLPGQTSLGLSQIEAAQQLLPGQTEAQQSQNTLTTAQNTANLGLLPAKTQATGMYLDQAINGVNIEDRMGKAGATMAGQYKDAGKMLTRQSGRMGGSPSSGKLISAMNALNMDRARNTGMAKDNARTNAETENFRRLQGASNFGLPVM